MVDDNILIESVEVMRVLLILVFHMDHLPCGRISVKHTRISRGTFSFGLCEEHQRFNDPNIYQIF